ncbi:immunity 52 family protein [Burkholderia ubonensis]|uniref:immunity 52 family protein n=1 Tax=Burkholderia ubonensis TaxID=101571 RepID=UPI00075AC241|nr:immunity 52 family protein [Burkholderia ubonensis]KVP78229.1 LysR family transcriptional regulator [Burkholderia ubonensis]OJA92154.1 LysR family transcriptional regulator [Burkholderia ubonensis]
MDIRLKFRDDSLDPTNFGEVLSRIQIVTAELAAIDPTLNRWYARGKNRDEALLYQAFEDGAPSTAILAVLKHKFADDPNTTYVALWDGNDDDDRGATLACHLNEPGLTNTFELSLSDKSILGNLDSVIRIVRAAVIAFKPAYVAVAPRSYAARQVFDDKPGVGWMIYLPTVITQQQVPEAREIVPIPETGKAQTGTVIVSTTDAPFSMKNPEHVETANRIEIRLVEQDLLPTFKDL